jgi:hypothetical protein
VAEHPVLGGDVDVGVESLEQFEDLVVGFEAHGQDVEAHPPWAQNRIR